MFIRTERSVREFVHFYPVVTGLILLNLILWIFTQFFEDSIGNILLNYGIGFNLAIYQEQEYWRFITPIFLHANMGHVMFNSFALFIFGPALERMVGKFRFLIFYLATGIIGNIGTYVIDPLSIVPHLGASGAIYGLLGAYIYMTLRRHDLIDPHSAQMVRIIFIIGLITTFLRSNINIAAHLFGFLAGALLGPILLQKARPFYKPVYRKELKDDEIGFDPNRWKKRRFLPEKIRRNALWIIIGIFVLLYIISTY